ncbi:hypothetical protein L9F63_017397, partial [Diploptera punctata]
QNKNAAFCLRYLRFTIQKERVKLENSLKPVIPLGSIFGKLQLREYLKQAFFEYLLVRIYKLKIFGGLPTMLISPESLKNNCTFRLGTKVATLAYLTNIFLRRHSKHYFVL